MARLEDLTNVKLTSQTVDETNGAVAGTGFTEDTDCCVFECLGLHPTVLEGGALLLGGLALSVAVRRCEVSLVLGDGGPEEGSGFRPCEVNRYVEVFRGHWHNIARIFAVN